MLYTVSMQRSDDTGYQRGNLVSSLLFILLGAVLVVASAYVTYVWQHDKVSKLQSQVVTLQSQVEALQRLMATPAAAGTEYRSPKGVKAVLFAPASGATVTSPIGVIGTIPGSWSFEASFPVLLKDSTGAVIAQGPAHILGSWMTDQPVPFSVQLTYTATPSGAGVLILQKDNPSGLAANDDSISAPVRF